MFPHREWKEQCMFVMRFTIVALLGGVCALSAADQPSNSSINAVNQNTAGCNKLQVSAITASTDDENVASNAIDGSLATRWSGNGVGAYIPADLGSAQTV